MANVSYRSSWCLPETISFLFSAVLLSSITSAGCGERDHAEGTTAAEAQARGPDDEFGSGNHEVLDAGGHESPTPKFDDDTEHYVEFSIASRRELELIARIVSIDNVDNLRVRAYGGAADLKVLARRGYSYRDLPHPGINHEARMGVRKRDGRIDPAAYPTYEDYETLMKGWARTYPHLCKLVDLGQTTNTSRPHRLWALKISDEPEHEEDEPEVFLSSTMHGDETVGFVMLLRFIEEFLTQYGEDAEIKQLVDNLEIWVNPLANPDGTFFRSDRTVDGAIRSFTRPNGTYAGIDPNRNYPEPGEPLSEVGRWLETRTMMRFAAEHPFVLGANLHGGAEVVNYPWDARSGLHVDDAWFKVASRAYADVAQTDGPRGYMTDLDNGITNGYDWYPAYGSRQDFSTYFHGGREVTVEVSSIKNPSAARLPTYWNATRRALRAYIALALRGVRGIVRGPSGEPLAARVDVLDHDAEADRSYVSTDPDVGDYHRLLLPGTYSLKFTSPDMNPITVPNVVVGPGEATRVDVTLTPMVNTAALSGAVD